jgi:hypothetical protein
MVPSSGGTTSDKGPQKQRNRGKQSWINGHVVSKKCSCAKLRIAVLKPFSKRLLRDVPEYADEAQSGHCFCFIGQYGREQRHLS